MFFGCNQYAHVCFVFFFFFSSRRRHTRFDCDWSSDVCSSDLPEFQEGFGITFYAYGYGDDATEARQRWIIGIKVAQNALMQIAAQQRRPARSEERRVGKECRSRWAPYQ